MSITEIKKALVGTFQGMLKNIVSLANDSPLENDFKVLKVGDKSTPIELSENQVKINDLEANSLTLKGNSVLTGVIDGQVLGYTYLQPSGASDTSHQLQTSFTVEDSTHQISFTVPASGNVEIEATAFFDRSSTSDVTIYAGLSDNSTYNSIGQIHEYDMGGVKSDDEIDDEIITWKWTLTSLTPNDSLTYYVGFKSSDASAVNLKYGFRSTHNLAHQPFIIKAIALPSTIYDGS